MLVARTRERLEHEIEDYVVIDRDGMAIGCAALHGYADARVEQNFTYAVELSESM